MLCQFYSALEKFSSSLKYFNLHSLCFLLRLLSGHCSCTYFLYLGRPPAVDGKVAEKEFGLFSVQEISFLLERGRHYLYYQASFFVFTFFLFFWILSCFSKVLIFNPFFFFCLLSSNCLSWGHFLKDVVCHLVCFENFTLALCLLQASSYNCSVAISRAYFQQFSFQMGPFSSGEKSWLFSESYHH